jgi:hypothetical protein
MRRIAILLVALVAFAVLVQTACGTKGENSALVVTKVLPPAASGPDGGTVQCTVDPSGKELSFLPLGQDSFGSIALVVDNRLQNQTNQNPILRTDSSAFLPHSVMVTYEVLGAGTLGSAILNTIPSSGVVVSAGATGPVFAMLFPNGFGSVVGSVAPGTFIRATMHIEGKLLDGSSAKSSEREYLFEYCGAAGCSGNRCL